MAKFVYPAIFYYDNDYNNYAVALPDVNIYTEGDTIEDAYKNAQEFLLSYLDCCEQLNQAPEKPSVFNEVVNAHKQDTVMLVSVEFENKKPNKQNVESNNNDLLEDFNNILSGDDDFSLPEID